MIENSFLRSLIEAPEQISDFGFDKVSEILNEAESIFEKEELLLELNMDKTQEAFIIGDIHGNLDSLMKIYDEIQSNNPKYVVFLGDIVDRGQFQLECLLIVLALKILHPERYYILRGNHETVQMNKSYGFYRVFTQKFARSDRFAEISQLYKTMPICAVINDSTLCLHGGIPQNSEVLPKLKELGLKKVDKTVPPVVEEGIYEIMWNDPKQMLTGFSDSYRGPGIKFFGQDVFEEFMEENGLTYLIRSHECFPEGYRWYFEERLLSIFSAENYRGESMPNPASFAIVKDNSVIGRNLP
jgi:diadenosine tetraphosphatase ApaH/serine/threonine PP2A family protein phosphatase